MLPYLSEGFGNPSSAHAFGRAARAALDEARERLAGRLARRAPRDRVHLGRDRGEQPRPQGRRLGRARPAATGSSRAAVEHHAVGHSLRYLEKFGFEIVELPVDRYGRVDPDDVDAAITDRTIARQRSCSPTTRSARSSRSPRSPSASAPRRGVVLHVDAVQAAPWVDLDLEALGADLVSLGRPQVRGAEGHRAPCTSATGPTSSPSSTAASRSATGGPAPRTSAGAVGMATAYELSCAERPATVARVRRLRDRLRRRRPGGRGRRADRPSARPAAGPPVGRRPRHRRRVGRPGPRPRGDRDARSARPARRARPRCATS